MTRWRKCWEESVMTNEEYMNQVKGLEINREKAAEVEKVYHTEFPLFVQAIISNVNQPVFLEDCRVLAYSEIINAKEDLKVDFAAKKIIPLIDCGENDFIVYHFDTKKWSMYNIIENCSFREKESLDELLYS